MEEKGKSPEGSSKATQTENIKIALESKAKLHLESARKRVHLKYPAKIFESIPEGYIKMHFADHMVKLIFNSFEEQMTFTKTESGDMEATLDLMVIPTGVFPEVVEFIQNRKKLNESNKPGRMVGNTTRQADAIIQKLFEGEEVSIMDHYQSGESLAANRFLLERVKRRMNLEHPRVKLSSKERGNYHVLKIVE